MPLTKSRKICINIFWLLDFIQDLHIILQTDTSLLLTWTEYISEQTLGFYICINGHQVRMVILVSTIYKYIYVVDLNYLESEKINHFVYSGEIVLINISCKTN